MGENVKYDSWWFSDGFGTHGRWGMFAEKTTLVTETLMLLNEERGHWFLSVEPLAYLCIPEMRCKIIASPTNLQHYDLMHFQSLDAALDSLEPLRECFAIDSVSHSVVMSRSGDGRPQAEVKRLVHG